MGLWYSKHSSPSQKVWKNAQLQKKIINIYSCNALFPKSTDKKVKCYSLDIDKVGTEVDI